jgi:hypothetical protein
MAVICGCGIAAISEAFYCHECGAPLDLPFTQKIHRFLLQNVGPQGTVTAVTNSSRPPQREICWFLSEQPPSEPLIPPLWLFVDREDPFFEGMETLLFEVKDHQHIEHVTSLRSS